MGVNAHIEGMDGVIEKDHGFIDDGSQSMEHSTGDGGSAG